MCTPIGPTAPTAAGRTPGVITLNISDVARPSAVAQLNYAPPFLGFTHTVLPLFSRDLLVVTQEATTLGGTDYPKLVWLMDNRLETNPVIISTLSMHDTDDFFNRPGRYGAHNIHENRPGPLFLRPTPWCTPPSSTAASASSTPPTPCNPRK